MKNSRNIRCLVGGLQRGLVGWVLCWVVGIAALGGGRRGWGAEAPPFTIGFSEDSFGDVNPSDAAASIEGWAQVLFSERGPECTPHLKILRDVREIEQALTNRLVDAVNLTTHEYFALRDRVVLEDMSFPSVDGHLTEEYVLLVHRNSGFTKLEDLRGRSLIVLKSPRASVAHVWLDVLLAEHGAPQLETFFGTHQEAPGFTKVVLSIFFRRGDAGLVTRSGFQSMIALNPQVGRELLVVANSPGLVTSVFGFRSDYVSPIRMQVLSGQDQWHTSPSGLQLLKLLQCDRLERHRPTILASTLALMNRHFQLCGPHVPGGNAEKSPRALSLEPGQP